jgi:hypothetical protein
MVALLWIVERPWNVQKGLGQVLFRLIGMLGRLKESPQLGTRANRFIATVDQVREVGLRRSF